MKISIEKVIRSMSIALDLSEISSLNKGIIVENITNINYSNHKFMNHSQRTTYIAMELATELILNEKSKQELYASSLLHDIGASTFFTMCHSVDEFINKHCIIGCEITKNFPFFYMISNIIMYHHENWDGSGPMNIKGNLIPIESQIIRIADILELLFEDTVPIYKQKDYITNWVIHNKNIIFSDKIVNAFLKISSKDTFWFNLYNINSILDSVSPSFNTYLNLKDFEKIADIFSNIIDNKSKFTARHSKGISELAYKVSKYLNYPEDKCIKMKIAGLLHDIGKLAIPTEILDKPGPLSKEEFYLIKSHAYYTKIILDNIGTINDISDWASNHHEKLNGKGYPRCLKSDEISEESRILAVCDIYQALTENRPYRKGLSNIQAFDIIDDMVRNNLICENATKYLKNSL